MTDGEHATLIREAVRKFNQEIMNAHVEGIRVEIEVNSEQLVGYEGERQFVRVEISRRI